MRIDRATFAYQLADLKTAERLAARFLDLPKTLAYLFDQIERFYARNLSLSREIAVNLQNFGSEDQCQPSLILRSVPNSSLHCFFN
jgi:hypothetical protein